MVHHHIWIRLAFDIGVNDVGYLFLPRPLLFCDMGAVISGKPQTCYIVENDLKTFWIPSPPLFPAEGPGVHHHVAYWAMEFRTPGVVCTVVLDFFLLSLW